MTADALLPHRVTGATWCAKSIAMITPESETLFESETGSLARLSAELIYAYVRLCAWFNHRCCILLRMPAL